MSSDPPVWSVETGPIGGGGLQLTAARDSTPAGFAEVVAAWRFDAGFRDLFNGVLAAVPFDAYRWETPGVTLDTWHARFEGVVLPDPALERPADPAAFAEQFAATDSEVVTFPNLGRDAILIAPRPINGSDHAHLARFVRSAPSRQRHELWRAVGDATAARVGARPVWLNSAGAGVPWLHIRLDDRPKYYRHAGYRRA